MRKARRLKERGHAVTAVLTSAGARFVTPLSLAALTGNKVYDDLFSLTDETEMGHIELSRSCDLLVVAPATADSLAKLAAGLANDLASTLLLATDKPVLMAPAMNVRMWEHAATQANLQTLKARDIAFVGPGEGEMACGEFGLGRMAEPMEILAAIEARLGAAGARPLGGLKALVTSGPTHEPIDPVRFIANRSSGRQGHAVAAALAALGAETILISGPTALACPVGVKLVEVETADQMMAACRAALPVTVAVCAAAVADWKARVPAGQKLKKDGDRPPALEMVLNPDILATLSAAGPARPRLVVGFAAETENLLAHARAKHARKGCDWMLANDVSATSGTFGGSDNSILFLRGDGEPETWPRLSKSEVAQRLAQEIAQEIGAKSAHN